MRERDRETERERETCADVFADRECSNLQTRLTPNVTVCGSACSWRNRGPHTETLVEIAPPSLMPDWSRRFSVASRLISHGPATLLGVWSALGARGTFPNGGGLPPPPVDRVYRVPGVAQTPIISVNLQSVATRSLRSRSSCAFALFSGFDFDGASGPDVVDFRGSERPLHTGSNPIKLMGFRLVFI